MVLSGSKKVSGIRSLTSKGCHFGSMPGSPPQDWTWFRNVHRVSPGRAVLRLLGKDSLFVMRGAVSVFEG